MLAALALSAVLAWCGGAYDAQTGTNFAPCGGASSIISAVQAGDGGDAD